MFKNSARLLVAAANLLTAGSAFAAVSNHADSAPNNTITMLNAASVKAVEASWLEVPNSCKARGFNADAQPVAVKEARARVQAIYASLTAV